MDSVGHETEIGEKFGKERLAAPRRWKATILAEILT